MNFSLLRIFKTISLCFAKISNRDEFFSSFDFIPQTDWDRFLGEDRHLRCSDEASGWIIVLEGGIDDILKIVSLFFFSYRVKGQLFLDQKLQLLTRLSSLCKLLFELRAAKLGDLWASFWTILGFLKFLVALTWDWSHLDYIHRADRFLGSIWDIFCTGFAGIRQLLTKLRVIVGVFGNLQAFGISAEKKLRRSILRSFVTINSIVIAQKKFWCVVLSWFVKYQDCSWQSPRRPSEKIFPTHAYRENSASGTFDNLSARTW